MEEMQVVVFTLNNEYCGVETSQVQQILKYQDITKVPRMPKFVDGVINLRGKVVPVINLNSRFDLGETKVTDLTKIIVTMINNNLVGFVVNDVIEIIKLGQDDLEVAPKIMQSGGDYLKSIGKHGSILISILDMDHILSASEVKKLKN